MASPVSPLGLFVSPNFVTPESNPRCLALIDSGKWREDLGRLTQQYGARYNYSSRKLDYDVPPIAGSVVEPIVQMLQPTFATLSKSVGGKEQIEQVIVNDYQPGQKISKHTDSPLFGPVVMTYTIGTGTIVTFKRAGHRSFKVEAENGTVLAMTGESRDLWTHETAPIAAGGRRVSVTFRTFK